MKLIGWKMGCVVLLSCAAVTTAGCAQTFNTVLSFDATDGAGPFAGLVQATNASLYGTTYAGGGDCAPFGCGTIFKISASGTLTTLHSFDGTDGEYPLAGLVQSTDGSLYGTTSQDGLIGCLPGTCGTVFKISRAGTLVTLYHFCSQVNCTDGSSPNAIVQGIDGSFYGTTQSGGDYALGTVFKVTPVGALTTLYNFCQQAGCLDGASPLAGLIQASDGNFYGTTSSGGSSKCAGGCGTIFRITPAGTLTTLYRFQGGDGEYPEDALVEATDGSFYGTANGGGNAQCGGGCGTVFKMTFQGKLITLHAFDGTDGEYPVAGLMQATDGEFYGTTSYGALNNAGTVFKITPRGALTTLHTFCEQTGCPDGENASGVLLQATNGTFYGTTYLGGTSNSCAPNPGCGTMFSLSTGLGPFVAFVQAAGKVGKTAQILGQGFRSATQVSFNGVPANFKIHADTFLTATVPEGANTGYVTVTTPSGVLKSNVPFHVIP